MSSKLHSPIILFGNTRSGTTIVQKVISTHPNVVGWYEPNPIWMYPDPGRIHDEFDKSDASKKTKHYIRKRFLKYQEHHGNRVIMEKTPQNILRIPYVREIFPDATFLFIVRDPFSFISSVEYKWQLTVTGRGILRRLKDTPLASLPYWVKRYTIQQYNKRFLHKKYLSIWGPRYKGIQDDLETNDLLTVIARQWSVPSMKSAQDMESFDDGQILKLRYEDFVDDPISNLEDICAHCGLDMSSDMVESTRAMVKSDRKNKWLRFDKEQLANILPEIRDEMGRHGYDIPQEISQPQVTQLSRDIVYTAQ